MSGMELFFIGLIKVILINVVLSGDNAVVIALACRNLPANQQKKAYVWGSLGAVILMILLTIVALWLLRIPFLQVVGGALLVVIAVNLLKDENEEEKIKVHSNLLGAIKTIIVADVVMSLDNTVAVAATANGNLILIAIGLAVSIPLIVWGASLLTKLMNRFPIIIYAGAALLGYTAGEMIVEDKIVGSFLEDLLPAFHWIIPVTLVLFVLIFGRLRAVQHQVTEG